MRELKIGDLRIKLPIIQGGMGIGISMSELASAVANTGGIGIISTVAIGLTDKNQKQGYKKGNIEVLKNEIRKAKQRTKGILGVNIMSVVTDFSDMVKTSIDEGIDIIFSGAGLPLDLPKYLPADAKTKLVPIVSSGRAADILCSKWKQNYNYLPDALVVEGPKAGGHLGFKANALEELNNTLENLVKDVVAVSRNIKEKFKKEIPVIAAGGIFDGKDMYNIMKKGASAVQLGTRFVATKECDASDEFKNAFIQAHEEDIKIIKSPVGMPGRTIFNKFLDEAIKGNRRPKVCKHNCIRSCNPKTTEYCISEALIEAYQGNLEKGFAFSGINGNRIENISTVEDVIKELKSGFLEAESEDQSHDTTT
ncbi:MAG TPA: nitronate monooxygenase family protein [Bacteroidales bacterium]|nr:nitronate monooxygenase family protein [Bacteroidales bacterium]